MNMDTEHFTVNNNLVFQPLKKVTREYSPKRDYITNFVSGYYAIYISLSIACLTVSLLILNQIKQNQVDADMAKERVRQENIDGIFREEDENEGDDDGSSSSSSYQGDQNQNR